jgi:MFS family permease
MRHRRNNRAGSRLSSRDRRSSLNYSNTINIGSIFLTGAEICKFSTLFYGVLSDRLGRRLIILVSLLAFIILTAFAGYRTLLGAGRGLRTPSGMDRSGRYYRIPRALVSRV